MHAAESAYWDACSRTSTEKIGLIGEKRKCVDNLWKRCELVSRVLKHRPLELNILEIGAALGVVPMAVQAATLQKNTITLTDVSPRYCEHLKSWSFNAINTDILALPDGPFDMIWAFDSLEHVRPEDRPGGWAEISRVLKKPGILLINSPSMNNPNAHDPEFDHDWSLSDVADIVKTLGDAELTVMERYRIEEIKRDYTWWEIERR